MHSNGDANGLNGTTTSLQLPIHTNGTHTNGDSSRHTQSDISSSSSDSSSPTRANGNGHTLRPRKDSLALAPPFIVSAPGQTIVYGEHAVVHGKAAIAAAISLRSYLLVTTLSKSQRTVSLKFTDIGLDVTWSIHDLPWKLFKERKKKYYDRVTSLDQELVEAIQPFIKDIGKREEDNLSPQQIKVQQHAASAFLYLFLSLGSERSPGCVYAMRSTIPIAAGLGSSASVSVCIAAALLIQSRALAGPHEDQQGDEAQAQLERINRWAFVGELMIHGNPSGVDNTVAAHGHAVHFQRKDYAKPPAVEVLHDFPELDLLLVDTCVPRSTATEVAKVGKLKELHPTVVETCLHAIDNITQSVYERITSAGRNLGEAGITHLGELMGLNHGLLASLGVSHPRLERIRALVDESGVGWAKLTGAGGGGCGIALLKPGATETPQMKELLTKLENERFKKYTTTLGGDGVGVLYPAVIGEEEIDEELFLTAHGREGVEELVGSGRDQEAWKFWRV